MLAAFDLINENILDWIVFTLNIFSIKKKKNSFFNVSFYKEKFINNFVKTLNI